MKTFITDLIRRFRTGALPVLLFAGTALAAGPESPKYIFLFIGDGMGVPQVALAAKAAGKNIIAGCPAVGLTSTASLDHFITDSAAAATALACGEKTDSGVVGRTPDGKPLRSLVEEAKARGRRTGVITSVSLDHATPAGFYASVPSRRNYYDIAVQMGQSGIDFLGGGGLLQPRGSRGDRPDAWELARASGYTVVNTLDDFAALRPGGGKVIAVTPVPTAEQSLPYAIDRMPGTLTLRSLTVKAIELLDNPGGFFLMVEGGMIDWACHANDAATALAETVAFQEAIEAALKFAAAHPAETLIVITADHETGGMTLGHRRIPYGENYRLLENQKMSFQVFSGKLAELRRAGKFDRETVEALIVSGYGLKFTGSADDPMLLSDSDAARLRRAWRISAGNDREAIAREYGGYEPLAVTAAGILAEKAGIGWTTFAHTALPVMTAATGVDAGEFSNFSDNTDIAKKIRRML